MYKRMTAVFCVLTVLMTWIIYRIYYIDASDYLQAAATVQGKYRLSVATTRGTIYDRNMNPLVNNQHRYVAAVLPTPQSAGALLYVTEEEKKQAVLEQLNGGTPFAIKLSDAGIYSQGIDVFRVPERYSDRQLAPHIVGYLSDGVGVAGIERAYDELLTQAGGEIGVLYRMDAAGRMMENTAIGVERHNEQPDGGVVLTLDSNIQAICQAALESGCEKGAVVVMDIYSGEVLGMASIPAFDQNDIPASLESTDAPFVNRAISGYNIGSVFKLLVSAAALESGISRFEEFDCQGYIDISGQVFRCNNDRVHGKCNMERALEVSCNCYFIDLAQKMPPEILRSLVANMGLGKAVELAPGIITQPGNLPDLNELAMPAGYANFSFGQGSSLASPLQMAQAVAAIANTGMSVTPTLVRGTTLDGIMLHDKEPVYAGNQVISERTAKTVSELMVKVVEEGSGKPAKPESGGAGGKTSSAQTGQMAVLSDGSEKEIVHAWFAGFFPAEKPKYSIVVMVEGGESGEQIAAPIFKQIADGIATLK